MSPSPLNNWKAPAFLLAFTVLSAAISAPPALAQGAVFEPAPGDRQYSPYPSENFPRRVYFGDTHLHTSYSTDAGMAGQEKVGPDEAYRFAKGEVVESQTGQKARLRAPLDFLVVADHAELLGLAPFIRKSDPTVLSDPLGKKWHDMVKAGKGYDAFIEWLNFGAKRPFDSPEMTKSAWGEIVDAAEKHNQPGLFTAFIGFEWTSHPKGDNLHRVVVFRDNGDKAKQVVPFSAYDSEAPEELWKYMDRYEQKTGGRMLAIPHNGNLSNGRFFEKTKFDGSKWDRNYVESRAKREPLVEITQAKGTGETHPLLSPEDEFADFGLLDKTNLQGSAPKTNKMLETEYARQALMDGLLLENQFGTNPYKFGLIGSTDNHTGLATAEEKNWFGKAHMLEPSAERYQDVLIKSLVDPKLNITALDLQAAGLVAVWANENTRTSLFDAMERKEAYGTSGTRLQVRVFGGWDFSEKDLASSEFAKVGYDKGVPMGGDLKGAPSGKAPSFVVRAMREVEGGNLDRIQVIKGWLDKDGKTHERIYDVAVSGDRKIDKNGRCKTPVGTTVNEADASFTNTIGAPFLQAFWKDPDFDPAEKAFYYVRVLEIPTPTWLAFDAKYYSLKMPKGARLSSQERAFTSPIWYSPK
ncbi:DUF3604 domain-containing protein [Microbulbifer salipaludis]|uniref:DUF3604 domain-containing protein n=1 Tax=Microbulbifer salipaludis TaxID=187980 RepID=A0ABS3E2N2_9GAMM|nr:DUF3604 domain-containing protein [Microbulbifer salipaludis]MBN8429404.1 DUF3604 domain-containing protein [Microbulbifer salipaludis]